MNGCVSTLIYTGYMFGGIVKINGCSDGCMKIMDGFHCSVGYKGYMSLMYNSTPGIKLVDIALICSLMGH